MSQYRARLFAEVFETHAWGSAESVSGYGSDTSNTREIVAGLPTLLKELGIRSLLDIPCGDFHWMQEVDLGGASYLGADIVPVLIERNQAAHGRAGRSFEVLDLVDDELPPVDMIMVRDCFIHFTNELIFTALRNICRSKIQYLCMTQDDCVERYCGSGNRNIDLARAIEGVNSEFRPINFRLPPFEFPEPVALVKDGPAWDGFKALGVWPVPVIRALIS